MTMQKGVYISGLGTFTFSQLKLDVCNRHILFQQPVFILSERLCHSHGLKQTKPLAAVGDIPVLPLNFSALSMNSPFDRDVVKGCIRETLLLLLRAIAAQRTVIFTFRGIGVLLFCHNNVKMKFYKDFISAMDGTGKPLWTLTNRPGTSSSVVSGKPFSLQRPVTSDPILLPNISLGETPKEAEKDEGSDLPSKPQDREQENGREIQQPAKDFISAVNCTGKLLWAPTNRPGTSSSVVSRKPFSLQRPMTSDAVLHSKISSGESPREAEEDEGSGRGGREIQQPAKPKYRLHIPQTKRVQSTHAKAPPGAVERLSKLSEPPEGTIEQGEVKREEPYCLDHTRAGQELCYLCMQRAQRNLYVVEDRRREEQEEGKILLLAEQQRDEQFLQKEQAEQVEKRKNSKKIAEFNLGIAEVLRAKKSPRPSQFEGLYIFAGRPVTPPTLLKERHYRQELMEQVACKKQQHIKSCQDHELVDRLHQLQLTDEIAKQKSQELRQKKESVQSLQKALGTQLEYQGKAFLAQQPDSDGPVFGLWDRAPEALAEKMQRAQRLYRENLSTANTKRKEVLFNRLNEQRKESVMLHRNRKELIVDRLSHYERLQSLRASLEDTWKRNADLKRHQDLEEKAFIRSGSRLLLDQCEQYRYCYQCKRKSSNCGESNICKESCYIPGS